MDNYVCAWLDEAVDVILDDFDPDEDDSDGEEEDVLNDNPKCSDECIEKESKSEFSCSDDSSRNDFREYKKVNI